MTTRLLRSTPLRPLSARMRGLTRECIEFWAATAFLSKDAVLDALDAATKARAAVRILTGTFGNCTRRSTFQALLRKAKKNRAIKTAVWHCGTHGDFHGKVYLWKLSGGDGVAWIGSANLTDGGMQNEGELVLQIQAKWTSSTLKRLRVGFEAEWKRAEPLSLEFVTAYREAKRTAPDQHVFKHRSAPLQRRPAFSRGRRKLRYFTTNVTQHVREESPLYRRAERLTGSAEYWMHLHSKTLKSVRIGDRCMLVDLADSTAALIQITDVVPDGNARIFA